MARWQWRTRFLIMASTLATLAVACVPPVAANSGDAARGAGDARPTELVSPAPEVNPKAVVWRTQTPPAKPKAGDVWINPKDSSEMVYVPAGSFLMGSTKQQIPKDRIDLVFRRELFVSEIPQHRVHLDAYWIDRYPVTVAQYRRFCQATGRNMPYVELREWVWEDDHPIVNVKWQDAAAYAAREGKQLPTEAQWEKAARGTDGRLFPWGSRWDTSKCAWHPNTGRSLHAVPLRTLPVGYFPSGASPYGALDMAGIVWQWCRDWYDDKYYQSAPARNPVGPTTGHFRAVRGGSWDVSDPLSFRCATRGYSAHAYFPHGLYGFRCVRGLSRNGPRAPS